MSDEQRTQGGLVPSGTHGLTPRSAGLVRRGLDSLLAEEGREGELWNMYTDAGEKAWEQDRYAEAERMYLSAIREAESLGPQDLRLATSLENLANLYSIALERSDEAEALYERAKTIREQALGSGDPEVLRTLSLLASCYYEQGKYADAEPLYQRELVVEEEALGPEHPSVVNLLSLLGSCYYNQGKYTQAEPIYQRIVATLGKVPRLDTLNFFTLVISLKVLASCYYNQGDYAEAEPLYQRVLDIYEKEWGREDLDVATVLEQYAAPLRKTGGNAKADTLEERAKSIRARNAQEHPTQ